MLERPRGGRVARVQLRPAECGERARRLGRIEPVTALGDREGLACKGDSRLEAALCDLDDRQMPEAAEHEVLLLGEARLRDGGPEVPRRRTESIRPELRRTEEEQHECRLLAGAGLLGSVRGEHLVRDAHGCLEVPVAAGA